MPEVSVVMPAFNRWPMLGEAVGSVMAQHVDLELIIVDDGSTDETVARLRPFVEKVAVPQHPVRILRTENLGPAAARNLGVAVAASPLISFLDSDDLWRPNKMERQLDYMRNNPGCLVSQTDEIWIRRGVRVNPGRRHRKRGGHIFFESLRTCLISPSAVIMRTNIFQELGGFDEDLRAAEDYDLWLRLLLHYPVELLPEQLVIRRAGHPGQLSATMPAIDRFRILALLKLLVHKDLSRYQRDAVCDALIEKCRVYGNGAARHGKKTEADWIIELGEMGNLVWRRFPDSSLFNAVDQMRTWLATHGVCRSSSSGEQDEFRRD